jgi:hypothetical protein
MDQCFASSLPRPSVAALVLLFALASAEAYGDANAHSAKNLSHRYQRLMHPLLHAGSGSLLAIGGASAAGHLDTIERFLIERTD